MDQPNLAPVLNTAVQAAMEARRVLLDYYGQLKSVREKSFQGLVSEADLEAEKTIARILAPALPGVPFLGEEGSFLAQDERLLSSQWVVDPLDGTTNYIHGFPIFCISIGLQLEGELVLGVIDVPILQKTYTAIRGGGAFVNGMPMRVRSNTQIKDALLATGFFPDNPEALREQIQIFSELVFEARGIRRAGAAAYDLCMVAEGVFDSFWEPNLKPWDAAAGVVLVREAGGVAWTYDGHDYRLGDNRLLTGNRQLCEVIQKRIQKAKSSAK